MQDKLTDCFRTYISFIFTYEHEYTISTTKTIKP